MKIFVQQAKSGQWLDEQCAWITEQGLAKVFGSTVEALEYCRDHQIREGQLVFVFPDPQFNFVIPVAPPP